MIIAERGSSLFSLRLGDFERTRIRIRGERCDNLDSAAFSANSTSILGTFDAKMLNFLRFS